MFKLHKVVSLSLVFFFGSSIIPNNPLFNKGVSAATAKIVTVDPSLQYQTMEGWGTSLAWWGKLVGEWKTDAKNEIMDLAFDKDKGLGLNMVRYNIGGAKSPNDTNLRPGGDVESYLLENGTYDWTKDAGQRWVLDQAKKKIAGDEFKAEAFSNSPPYFMTISGQSSGNIDGKSNLKSDQYQNFADYLTEVVKHFKSDYGITFDTIDPMNEPSTNYWKKGGNQEGCDFDTAAEKDTIFQDLSKDFNNNGISTKLAGFDETGIKNSIDTIKSADSKTIDAISQFNTHVYSDGSRSQLRDLAASLGKPLYMDEICTSGGAKHDANDIDNGLSIADYIFKDLKDMKTPGWDIWQVVDDEAMNQTNNSNWGLISAYWSGDNVEKYFITKQYYAMAHFSKFIRPGYKIIDANNSDVVAAIDPDGQKLVLVTRNTSTSDEPLSVDLSRFNTTNATIKAYRTTGEESLADVSSGVSITNGNLTDTLPAKSMVTYVISNAKYSGEAGTTVNDNVTGTSVNQFKYSDSWSYYDSQSGAYSNDVHYSNTKDSYYEIKFKGNRIKLYGTFNSDAGIAGISIDGGAETNVDLYSAARSDNALMYKSPLLDGGTEHTVKVRITGEKNAASSSTFVIADRAVAIENSTDDEVVQNPQLTQVIAGYNSLKVKFNQIDGATSYNIKYGTASGSYTKVINNVTDTSYLITGLDNGTKYYVAVSAVVNGKESANSNELAESPVSPKDSNLLYYVNCGDDTPDVLENDEILGTNNSTQDQAYGVDPLTGKQWGYIADENKVWSQDKEASVGSNYGCERQYDGSTPQGGLTYKFEVPNGKYNITMGFYDPWSHNNRLEDILINGNVVATELCPNKIGMVPQNYTADVKDGVLAVRAQKSTDATDKPLISWIKVTKATHSVKYYANSGEGTVPADDTSYEANQTVTVKENTLTKTGYTFSGWNTKSDGSGTNYDPIDSNKNTLIIGDSDVTLYAQWKADTVSETTPAAIVLNMDDDTITAELKNQDGSEFVTNNDVVYKWYRNDELIDGENKSTHKVSDKDKGKKIKVKVEQYALTSECINIPSELTPTDNVTTPSAVKIEGIDKVDNTLEAQLLTEDRVKFTASSDVIYKWYRLSRKDSEDYVLVGNDKTYKLAGGDIGAYIKLIAIYDGKTFEDITSKIENEPSSSSSKSSSNKKSSSSSSDSSSSSVSNSNTSKDNNLSNNELNDGWKNKNDNAWTYIKNGKPATGWNQIDGSWYLMDSIGNMQTGWHQLGNEWYYLRNTGVMATGWEVVEGKWYFLENDGTMATGWKSIGSKWYYLYSNGVMASDTQIDGYTLSENGDWVE
ncbi:glycoside hydrolase [Clostridium sp.]|uniref:glycoside hydrolase n=1 Tax=Clostridium sp. TaxID=1506 RepID=UPI00284E707D|nr:glycoside hydrolase [Clostridium sp.]MDR3597373.1 glycoside hydrolase [Clostridium sp.]